MASASKSARRVEEDAAAESSRGAATPEHTFEDLGRIQEELEVLNEEAADRVLEIEAEFNQRRKPLYHRRAEVLGRIPDFWLQAVRGCGVGRPCSRYGGALRDPRPRGAGLTPRPARCARACRIARAPRPQISHHPVLHSILTERDREALKYLRQIEVIEADDLKSGYRIEMHFAENPFFHNSTLHKDFHYTDNSLCVTSSPIQWREGKNLTMEPDNAQGGKRRRGDEASFFSWFDVMDEASGVASDQDSLLIAEIIKQELWVDPVRYYNQTPDDAMLDVDPESWAPSL